MTDETLARLFAEQPEAAELLELSAGYAVFDTRKLVLSGWRPAPGAALRFRVPMTSAAFT